MKVMIDPGHNYSGGDTGASGNGLREQDVTFGIADKLRILFEGNGDEVKMTRTRLDANVGTSEQDSIQRRYTMANEWGADLFISIHCNSGGGTGTEVLVYRLDSEAAQIARRVEDAIVSELGMADRGVKARPELGVLRGTKCPAILVETGFLDNAHDARLLRDDQQGFADAIFHGVTGLKGVRELTEPSAIVWEYTHRGIVLDGPGMIAEMEQNPDGRLYWLARKALQYMREHDI